MCEASRAMKDLNFAGAGEDLSIQDGGRGRLFARADGCFVCVPFGATMIFQDLPQSLQRALDVGPEAEVFMVSPNDSVERDFEHRDDQFVLKGDSSKRFWMRELPYGTRCRVTHVSALVTDQLLRAAGATQVASNRTQQPAAASRPAVSARQYVRV